MLTSSIRNAVVLAIGLMLTMGHVRSAHAQTGPSILFSPDGSVPTRLQQRIATLLSEVAPLVDPMAPLRQGDLAVTAQAALATNGSGTLHLGFYDAVSAAPLMANDVPLVRGDLPAGYDSNVAGRVRQALGMLGASQSTAPPPQQPASPTEAAVPAYESEGPGQGGPAPEAVGTEGQAPARPVALRLGLGFGLGMHALALPTALGTRRVPASSFAAMALSVAVDSTPDSGFAPGIHLQYHSSVGYSLTETPIGGVEERSPSRSHEFVVDAVANAYFGEPRTEASLYFALGYDFRNLRNDVVLTLPGYTMGGPHLAVAVRVPFADGHVLLSFGPDVTWFTLVGPQLARHGVDHGGFGLGGAVDLDVQVSDRIALRVDYRETHVGLSTQYTASFSDMQRFITLGAAAFY